MNTSLLKFSLYIKITISDLNSLTVIPTIYYQKVNSISFILLRRNTDK